MVKEVFAMVEGISFRCNELVHAFSMVRSYYNHSIIAVVATKLPEKFSKLIIGVRDFVVVQFDHGRNLIFRVRFFQKIIPLLECVIPVRTNLLEKLRMPLIWTVRVP